MTNEAMQILEDMIKEYELLAKYNGGRDYKRYSDLLDICKELKDKEAAAVTICDWCNKETNQTSYVGYVYHLCPECAKEYKELYRRKERIQANVKE